jgi:hypothetical protein
MIVAVIAMRMMQAPVDDVVQMVAVRHGLVTAAWAMHMATGSTGVAGMIAAVGVGGADLDHMLVVVRLAVDLVAVVQVAVVQIVHMVAVANGLMAAAGSMLMVVVGMGLAGVRHGGSSAVVDHSGLRVGECREHAG